MQTAQMTHTAVQRHSCKDMHAASEVRQGWAWLPFSGVCSFRIVVVFESILTRIVMCVSRAASMCLLQVDLLRKVTQYAAPYYEVN